MIKLATFLSILKPKFGPGQRTEMSSEDVKDSEEARSSEEVFATSSSSKPYLQEDIDPVKSTDVEAGQLYATISSSNTVNNAANERDVEASSRNAEVSEEKDSNRGFLYGFFGTLVFTACVVAIVILALAAKNDRARNNDDNFDWPHPSNVAEGRYDKAGVSTDHLLCSEIAVDILKKGGNAVDAAVAIMFCLGVTNPESSGLGGGFIMTLYNRETAPAAADENMFVNDTEAAQFGYRSIAVPSELAGSWYAYKNYGSGSVAWKDLVLPSAKLCREGTTVTKYMETALYDKKDNILRSPTMKRWINPATNDVWREGDVVVRENLAETLELIANSVDPVKLFYHGVMADDIVKEIREHGGIITKADLSSYEPTLYEQMTNDHFRGDLVMCGAPPPSSFSITQLIVSVMSALYPEGHNVDIRSNSRFYHDLIETMKFAYAQRTYLGDAKFVPKAMQIAENLTTPEYTKWVVERIKDKAQPLSYYGGFNESQVEDHGTAHVSVIDEFGNAVGVTTTINLWFGAVVESEKYGIIWNDEMDDFSIPGVPNAYGFPPSESNFIKPGKRPMSSMTPTVIFDRKTKQPRMVVGASGGSKIISATAKTIIRHLFFGETLKEAIDAPMLHNQFVPITSMIDQYFPTKLRRILENRHDQNFTGNTGFKGVTHTVALYGGGVGACGDFRRETPQDPAGY
ncbi:unnamed protein product [Cylicocyclus nassatus]|uniref:Uncharacterized protein n=1 Tax=Cylicocyclus nassatus TaxID=53992 RepID=A0AA36DNH8_CYLNA|nr:unnamed protein product [Cylicocyclus nassatus]